jgi:hypothetical protein
MAAQPLHRSAHPILERKILLFDNFEQMEMALFPSHPSPAGLQKRAPATHGSSMIETASEVKTRTHLK